MQTATGRLHQMILLKINAKTQADKDARGASRKVVGCAVRIARAIIGHIFLTHECNAH